MELLHAGTEEKGFLVRFILKPLSGEPFGAKRMHSEEVPHLQQRWILSPVRQTWKVPCPRLSHPLPITAATYQHSLLVVRLH